MYSKTQFWNAKYDLAKSLLYDPADASTRAMMRFLRELLIVAVENGEITPTDVDHAIKYSGVDELSDQDQLTIWMQAAGERYVGKLSHAQNQQLQRLFNACDNLVNNGRMSATLEIAELLFNRE